MNLSKRIFLTRHIPAAIVSIVGASLLTPIAVMAKTWRKDAYNSRDMSDSIRNVFDSDKVKKSGSIKIKVPSKLEEGSSTPVKVDSKLPNTTKIALFVEENNHPLVLVMHMSPSQVPYISAHIKVFNEGSDSHVTAIVESDGELYKSTKKVKAIKNSFHEPA